MNRWNVLVGTWIGWNVGVDGLVVGFGGGWLC